MARKKPRKVDEMFKTREDGVRSLHFQARLHEDYPQEHEAIQIAEAYLRSGFTQRELIREAMFGLQIADNHGWRPQRETAGIEITVKMQELTDRLLDMTTFLQDLMLRMADGTFQPPQEVRDRLTQQAERLGIDMTAANLSGRTISFEDVEDDESWA